MKKTTAIIVVLIAALQLNAQKMLSTKSASINFSATGGLEKIAAINNQVDCKLVDNTGQMVFALLVKGFKFENQLMEDHFNENYMESTKFPKASFKGFITNISKINFTKEGTYNADAEGTLTIHGVEQKVTATGIVTVANGKITLTSTLKIKLKDYKITGSYIGDKIAADATITINCKF
jgi:YceI-like domain